MLNEDPDNWQPPKVRLTKSRDPLLFGDYAQAWLASRTPKGKPLAARTHAHYRSLLDHQILLTFKDEPLAHIAPDDVDHWYALVAIGRPTLRAHA